MPSTHNYGAMFGPMRILLFTVTVASMSMVPAAAQGQANSSGQNAVSVLAGQFIYDYGGDQPYPYISVRAGRTFNRFTDAEVGVGYSRLSTKLYSIGETIQTYDAHTPFVSIDAAVHAILPLGRFSPYVGISAGFLHRGESKEFYGLSLNGSSIGFPVGARLMISRHVGIRGEFRYRSDRHDGFSHRGNDAEQSLGIVYRF
jgi:hypothetical protein